MTAYTEADLAAELEQSKLNVQLSVLLLFWVSCVNPRCVSILTMARGLGILVSIFDFSFLRDFFGTAMV
jgi:hypothetical protein